MTRSDDILPQGLEDSLPARAAAVTRTMRAALSTMDAHGYDRVRPPLVEFEKSLAARMDGVQTRQLFRFVDPASLRTLALRADITPQVGRIAATGLADAARPLRLCYAGDVAVIAADQLDPARQRLQLGAELIGADNVAAASEIVLLAIEALEQVGVRGITVDFTLPDLVDTLAAGPLELPPENVERVRAELDTKDAGGLRDAGGAAYLPLLYATGPLEDALVRLEALDVAGALDTRIEALRQIAAAVGDRARLTLDPTERHGFEYQNWFGFTVLAEGARRSLGRGGTYSIKGSEEAAIGFSLYVEPLLEALGDIAPDNRGVIYLPIGHDRAVAADLRADGWRTRAALDDGGDPAALGCTHMLQDGAPRAL